ncbi:hypothetical protein VPH35_060386 [Triticum aestivum]|nr:uncharacterized protein LOC109760564 [Aegilops tauschii subsp. strangulata]
MSNWQCSTVSEAKLRALVDAGMLPCLTEAREWIKPMLEDSPRPSQGYVVSFVAFHEHGFSVPAGRFIRAVLHEYSLELQHLNPNGIQHLVAFEAMCEGYLGIEAHWHLFRNFFMLVCLKDEQSHNPPTIGCTGIRLKRGKPDGYQRALDELQQRVALRVVLPQERSRVPSAGVHRGSSRHHPGRVVRWAGEEEAGEAAPWLPRGSHGPSGPRGGPRHRDWWLPCERGRAATAARPSPVRDDRGPGSLRGELILTPQARAPLILSPLVRLPSSEAPDAA